MKISAKLIWAAAVPAFLAAVVATGLAATLLPGRTLMIQQDAVSQVAADISELRDLARSYAARHESRPQRQYLALSAMLDAHLEEALEPETDYSPEILQIQQDAKLVNDIFDMVQENYERRSAVSPEVYAEAESRLTGQLFARLRGMTRDVAVLIQVIGEDVVRTQQRVYYAVATLTIISATILTWMLIFLRRGIMKSLWSLQAGTEAIASGRLDYRTGMHGRDELNDLGRSFDHMAGRLHEMTVSKDELEVEVVQRKRLERQLTQELQSTRTLLDVSASLAAWTDLPALIKELSAAVRKVVIGGAVIISTWDSGEGVMLVLSAHGRLLEQPVAVAAATVSPELRAAVRDREAKVSEGGEPALVESIGAGSGRVLHVPMVYRDVVVGLISIGSDENDPQPSQREIDLVQGVASQAAAALENARLYMNEHRVAETLQEALLALPQELPNVDFAHLYRSATEAARVGGDFYDLFEMDDGHLGITIGDVAGKGLDAAVLTSLVKTAIRIHAQDKGGAPDLVLKHTNDAVYRSTSKSAFVTVLFAVYDPAADSLTYASAGHTTGAVLGSDGVASTLPSTGPILGAFESIEFSAASAELREGDVLFLYTDGLTEARRMGELFGEERLMQLLSTLRGEAPANVVRGVVNSVSRFAGGRLSDDLAILALGPRAAES